MTKRWTSPWWALALAVLLGGPAHGQAQRGGDVKRGEYLVNHVAMCVECHSPRTPDGALDPRRLLQGAPMPVRSPFPGQQWAFRAPRLAGLPSFTDEEIIGILTQAPGARRPMPPMPPFRMSTEDAAAVAAYLRSLPVDGAGG